MTGFYILTVLTLIGMPVLAKYTYAYLSQAKIFARFRLVRIVMLSYTALYMLGLSLSGDLIDYLILSLSYYIVCVSVFMLYKKKNVMSRIVGIVGSIIITLIGLSAVLFLVIISFFLDIGRGYIPDKICHFEKDNKHYETRRFSRGFVTSPGTTYNFVTYRKFNFIPFEWEVNKQTIRDWEEEETRSQENPCIDISY